MLDQYQRRTGHSLGKILHMAECGADRKYGVLKTNKSTESMVRYSANMMRFNKVHFSENMTVGEGLQPQPMIDKLLQQMSEYRCEMKYNRNDIHAEAKYKWTGRQDDGLVALMMNMYWPAIFEASDYVVYRRWRNTL